MKPLTSRRTVNWPRDKVYLQVDDAAKLLQAAWPIAPIARETDSDVRGDLIKVVQAQDIRDEIITESQSDRISLVHPTLGVSSAIPQFDWLIYFSEFVRFAELKGIDVIGPDSTAENINIAFTPTGMPGRPSKSKYLIEDEFERRISDGKVQPVLADEAQALVDWLKMTHPTADRPTVKTIKNNLRVRHRERVVIPQRTGGN